MPEKYSSDKFINYNHLLNDSNIDSIINDSEKRENAFQGLGNLEDRLTNDIYDVSKSKDDKLQSLNDLNDVYQAKQKMFTELDTRVKYLQDRFSDTYTNNVNQKANLNIVNTEIEKTKQKNNYYNDEINNKVRNMQINTFYQKKYSSEIGLLKFIIYICIIIIGLSFANKRGLLSDNIFGSITGIIIGLSIIRFIYLIWDIFIRDKNDFDEIDYSMINNEISSTKENENAIDSDDENDNNNCNNDSSSDDTSSDLIE